MSRKLVRVLLNVHLGVKGEDFGVVAETIKRLHLRNYKDRTAYCCKEASKRLNVPFGIVDLSLAPTPAVGDSVAYILEKWDLGNVRYSRYNSRMHCNDAVKGSIMASGYVGGLVHLSL